MKKTAITLACARRMQALFIMSYFSNGSLYHWKLYIQLSYNNIYIYIILWCIS